jgi:hypothetical protein
MSSQTGYIGLSSSFPQPFLSCPASISPANRHVYAHHHSLINSIIALIASHSSDLLFVHVLLQALVKVLPPFKKQRIADELEPRCKLQGRVVEHRLQSVGVDVARVAHFIEVRLQIDVGLDKEDVVDFSGQTRSVYFLWENQMETHSHAPPIFHRWAPCSGFLSGTLSSRLEPEQP